MLFFTPNPFVRLSWECCHRNTEYGVASIEAEIGLALSWWRMEENRGLINLLTPVLVIGLLQHDGLKKQLALWRCGLVRCKAFTYYHTHFWTYSVCVCPELIWNIWNVMKAKLLCFQSKETNLLWVVKVLCRIGAGGVCFGVACIHHVICVHNSLTWAVQQYRISMFWLWAKKHPACLPHQL